MSIGTSFRLAPMSRPILILTVGLLALPVILATSAWLERALLAPALILVGVYAWVWLRFRPTRFVVHAEMLEVMWPLKRRVLRRSEIVAIHVIDGRTGAVLTQVDFLESNPYGPNQQTPPLSSYFELMDRLMPSVLGTMSSQKVKGTRFLLQ